MVPGSGVGITARLTAGLLAICLVLSACSLGGGPAETTGATQTTTTTSTTSTTSTTTSTTTTSTTTTTTVPAEPTTTEPLPEIDAEIGIPDGDGPFPAVVLVHGGGWLAGSPALMRPLARHLKDAGFLTVNTRYQLSGEVSGYPQAMIDVACAVRYAAAHPDSDGTVAVVGHSAGAHISAVVSLTGDQYTEGCDIAGSGIPDKLVGLAGPYDTDRMGFLMIPFFGGPQSQIPEVWSAGNPMDHTDENPSLDSLLMHGDLDGLVEYSFTANFDEALTTSGSQSLIEIVEGARHTDMHDPAFVGDLIIVWLEG